MASPNAKWTPEVQALIVESLRAGNFREVACAAAGITSRTLHNWCARGDKGEEPYAALAAEVNAAEAEIETRAVKSISKSDDIRAVTFFLERRFPKRWAQSKQVNVSGSIALESLDAIRARMTGEAVTEANDDEPNDDGDGSDG